MQLRHKIFQAMTKSWRQMCDEAAQFATQMGPERVISVSHSCDEGQGVIIVWFWAEEGLVVPEDE